MQPSSNISNGQPAKQMLQSNSTSALQARLRPENEHFKANTLSTGLNTLKPKALVASASTPALQSSTAPIVTSAQSKVNRIRNDVSSGQGQNFTKTLSTSTSAALLSPDPKNRTNVHIEVAASFRDTSPVRAVKDTMNNQEEENRAVSPSSRPIIGDDRIIPAKGSFIASLSMTQKQLHELYKVPHSFFYLQVRDTGHDVSSAAHPTVQSVYNLELISLDKVDKNSYFTLSKEGVTQFRHKISQFTGLAQWEREYKLFHRIANINFFKKYKRWKVRSLYFTSFIVRTFTYRFVFSPDKIGLFDVAPEPSLRENGYRLKERGDESFPL
ncbi:hypothetical protein EON65_01735 [archaeon]|nr:MAG: hypothetical protein EON65_01735 [archaeon]